MTGEDEWNEWCDRNIKQARLTVERTNAMVCDTEERAHAYPERMRAYAEACRALAELVRAKSMGEAVRILGTHADH